MLPLCGQGEKEGAADPLWGWASGNPWSGCHGESGQTKWARAGPAPLPPTSHPPARSVGSSCPTVRLSDLTPAGRRKCLLLEGMPERDQEMQENGQPERVMSKASRRGSQDRAGQNEGPKRRVRRRRGKGLPSGLCPSKALAQHREAQPRLHTGTGTRPCSSDLRKAECLRTSQWSLRRGGRRPPGP